MLVGEVLPMLQQAQLGVDGSTTADNTRDAVGCQGYVTQQDTSVDGPVVNTLNEAGTDSVLCTLGM